MKYLVGAIILMWVISALGGGNSFEAKMGWGIIAVVVIGYLLIS